MTSKDVPEYATVEMFNAHMDRIDERFTRLEQLIGSTTTELKNEIREVKYEIQVNEHDTAHLQTSVYWGFAIMALVIALVGYVIALAPMLRDRQQERREYVTRPEMEDAITEAVTKALRMK